MRTTATLAIAAIVLGGCAAGGQGMQARPAAVPHGAGVGGAAPAHGGLGCYGTLGVEAMPCPVKLTKKDGGKAAISVNGPGVALAAIIASDCVGPGSICNIVQTGYTTFAVSSVQGQNLCGTAYVVFEGVTASGSPIGTATAKIVNKYC